MTFQNNISVSGLSSKLSGRIILPNDNDYDAARTLFYGGLDGRPAAILRAADAEDVQRIIEFARNSGQELAVRSGGHSLAGHSVSDGGVVLDLSEMRTLDIDPDARVAWAEPGLTAGEYTKAADAFELATGFGDTGSVGLGGLTLAGGIGYLVRKYGLTVDSLMAADIVTADGQLLHVDAENHPDLFWAIRGGGGNFGVATRFQFRLQQVGSILGGLLILPATADVISNFMAEAESAPDELSAIANIMAAPPMPFLPKEHHGTLVVMAMMVYAGAPELGNPVIAPFRALATPIVDMVHPMRYPEVYPPEPVGYHPTAASHNMFVDSVDRSAAENILEHLKTSNASMAVTQLRALGGAMARVPSDAIAFAHRDSRIMVNLAALYDRPDDKAAHEHWASEFAAALKQDDDGAYIGFMGSESAARVHAAYPGKTWERLAAIKARYDPNNLFRLNQNILPSAKRS